MTPKEYQRRCNSMRVMSVRYPKADSVPLRLRHEAVELMAWAPTFYDYRTSVAIIGHREKDVQVWRNRYARKAS